MAPRLASAETSTSLDFGWEVMAIPSLLGLDHKQLTYLFQGRQFRLTDVHGETEFSNRLLTRA